MIDNAKKISGLTDTEALSLFASLTQMACEGMEARDNVASGNYLHQLYLVVGLRKLEPVAIDDIDTDNDTAWFTADTNDTGDNEGRKISGLLAQDALAFIAHLVSEGYGAMEAGEGYRSGYYIRKLQQVLALMQPVPVKIDVDPANDKVWFKV